VKGTDRLHTEGRYIKDEAGNVVWLRGVVRPEIAYCFSPDYQGWKKHHEVERDYNKLKNLGVNVVRLYLNKYHWDNHITLPNIDGQLTEYASLVDNIMSWCQARQIYVIIDLAYLTNDCSDTQYTKANLYTDPAPLIDWVTEVATRYRDNPYLIVGLLNEPPSPGYAPAPWHGNLDALMGRWIEICSTIIEAVKAVRPGSLFDIESPTFKPTAFIGRFLPYENIIYCAHHYYTTPPGGGDLAGTNIETYYRNGQYEQAKQAYETWLVNQIFQVSETYNKPTITDEIGVWTGLGDWWPQWIKDFYDISTKYGHHWVQYAWHGYWSPNPTQIDYHLLKEDWQTLSPIGEVWAQEMKPTPTPPPTPPRPLFIGPLGMWSFPFLTWWLEFIRKLRS
jgi:hypothetical protein